jgi:Rhodopirellula transposase DDE domain
VGRSGSQIVRLGQRPSGEPRDEAVFTISKGLTELKSRAADPIAPWPSRLPQLGAGRKRVTDSDPELAAALELLVDPVTRGDPQSPLRWTCKSTTQLARALAREGHLVSLRTMGRLL